MGYFMTGEYRHSIDAKGRLIIPSKLRDALGSRVYVTISIDKCLSVYSIEEFGKFTENLKDQIDTSTAEGRKIRRSFLANAADCELDSQGRIIIPNNLRNYAGLGKDVVIVGNMEKAEIWDRARYDEDFDDPDFSQENIAKKVEELHIRL